MKSKNVKVRPLRLWVVRVSLEAYVLAEDEEKAIQAQAEIERWEYQKVTAEPWSGQPLEGWNDGDGVYGTDHDVSLGEAKILHLAA